MQVILLTDVDKVGLRGDVVDVQVVNSGSGSYVGRARKIVNTDMGQCGCALGTNADVLWK